MKKSVLFLGAIGVIGMSVVSIYHTLTPKTNCVDEVIEITNASNVPVSMLLAPQPVLDILKPSLLSKTSVDKIDNVIVAAGIAQSAAVNIILMKILVNEDTPKDDVIFQEINGTFHKQPYQCRMNGKNYNIYVGKTVMPVE